jgi:hypothetical protein
VTLPGFPDAERAVCDLLGDLGTCGSETPKALQSELPYIRVNRTGGSDDLVTDTANVSVDVFAASLDDAKRVAEACRQRFILGPYRSDASFRTDHGQIDKAKTLSAPLPIPPTDSDNLRLVTASYEISVRR